MDAVHEPRGREGPQLRPLAVEALSGLDGGVEIKELAAARARVVLG